jgi:hypothetical protein
LVISALICYAPDKYALVVGRAGYQELSIFGDMAFADVAQVLAVKTVVSRIFARVVENSKLLN